MPTTDNTSTRTQLLIAAVRGAASGLFRAGAAWLLEHFADN